MKLPKLLVGVVVLMFIGFVLFFIVRILQVPKLSPIVFENEVLSSGEKAALWMSLPKTNGVVDVSSKVYKLPGTKDNQYVGAVSGIIAGNLIQKEGKTLLPVTTSAMGLVSNFFSETYYIDLPRSKANVLQANGTKISSSSKLVYDYVNGINFKPGSQVIVIFESGKFLSENDCVEISGVDCTEYKRQLSTYGNTNDIAISNGSLINNQTIGLVLIVIL